MWCSCRNESVLSHSLQCTGYEVLYALTVVSGSSSMGNIVQNVQGKKCKQYTGHFKKNYPLCFLFLSVFSANLINKIIIKINCIFIVIHNKVDSFKQSQAVC